MYMRGWLYLCHESCNDVNAYHTDNQNLLREILYIKEQREIKTADLRHEKIRNDKTYRLYIDC